MNEVVEIRTSGLFLPRIYNRLFNTPKPGRLFNNTVLPKNPAMKPDDDKRRLIPLEDIVATLVVIVVLAGLTLLIVRWIS